MSSPLLEGFLAHLYTDPLLLESFLADPALEAARAGLNEVEIAAMCAIDRSGLRMAADSYSHKRLRRRHGQQSLGKRLLRFLRQRPYCKLDRKFSCR